MKNIVFAVFLAIIGFTIYKSPLTWTQYETEVMAIAESTLEFVTGLEGKKNVAYKDSKGLWTIGVGHLIKPTEQHLMKAKLTDQEVKDLFRKDLAWCEKAVDTHINVPLSQNQYDALYSLCFNIGETQFAKSTVVRKLNQNDYHGAADAILMWNKPAVLTGRRQKERALFLQGI